MGNREHQRKSSHANPATVLFVEQTQNVEQASHLRELLVRLEPLVGFKMKVVERCGTSINSQPLLDETKCGRKNCIFL